jgi:hypothetical protein
VHSSRQDRLNSTEVIVGNLRIEVPASADAAVAGSIHDADVQLLLQHGAKRLRTGQQTFPHPQPSRSAAAGN